MLCVQCCHIFSFSPKSKKRKKLNPGSISFCFVLSFIFSSCASAVTLDNSGRETVTVAAGPCTFSSTESSSRQGGKHSEKGKGSDFGRETGD